MKNYFFFLLSAAFLITACESRKAENNNNTQTAESESERAPVTLKLVWETEPKLTTCESVLHDDREDVLYVANINGGPDQKDGNGFISKVSMDGKIVEEQWAKGMDAPKGMGLHDGKLFVTDIDKVREIDTKSGKITKTYPVQTAKFLNDIAVDKGKVYISDSRGGSVYLIEDGKLSTFMENLQGPNGLFSDGGDLLVALWDAKSLNSVDVSSKEITLRTEGLENPDGIELIGGNEYLVSSWHGLVHHIDSDWKKTLVLDTTADSVNAADIEYVKAKNLLLVPTFFKNTVRAYEVSK